MTDETKLPTPFPATQAVHPDLHIPPGFAAFSHATHRASTVVFKNLADMRAFGHGSVVHWRYGLHATPTSDTLCQTLAQIEGGKHALLLPSGLAAISLVYFALVKSGDDVLVPDNAYGPNRDHGEWMARQFGITVRYYDPMIGAGIADLIRHNTRLVWLEAPGSVTMEVPDCTAIAEAARAAGAITAIDNTWSGGVYYKPFAHGIDISVQALTKYQSGGSDVLMGATITHDETLHHALLATRMRMGWGVSADDCFLVLRGLPSLPARLAAHDAHAREVAEWAGRPARGGARAAPGAGGLSGPRVLEARLHRCERAVLDRAARALRASADRCLHRGLALFRDRFFVGRGAQPGAAVQHPVDAHRDGLAAGRLGERGGAGAPVHRPGRPARPDRRSEAGDGGTPAGLNSPVCLEDG